MHNVTMADVLNMNWGGPDFPAYEGRLEGDTAEAALAAFTGDDTTKADTGAQTDEPVGDGAESGATGEDPNAREQGAAEATTDGQLTDEQIQADPRFQELSTLRDDVVSALTDFGLVDDKGAPDLQGATLQLKDASILYDIMAGKGTPSALLDVMAQNAGWKDEQKQAIAQDLIGWLTKAGYLKDGQAAASAKKPGDAGFKDPIAERLDKLENERKTETQRAEQTRIQAHQKEVFETKFLPEVERLCKQKGVPAEDIADYAAAIAANVQGNKAILGRIEKGNFVDVNKFFSARYNAEVQRLQRWTKTQTAAAAAKEKNPKIPAGGATPHSAGSAKVNSTRNRDDRIAAATELL